MEYTEEEGLKILLEFQLFLKKYGKAMSKDHIEKYNRYVDKSMMMDSESYDILKLNDKLLGK